MAQKLSKGGKKKYPPIDLSKSERAEKLFEEAAKQIEQMNKNRKVNWPVVNNTMFDI